MKKYLNVGGLALAGILLAGSSYALGANIINIELPDVLTAAVGNVFNSSSNITITKNINSPKNDLISGRSQTFGVFDVKSNNVGDVSYLQNIPVRIKINDTNRNIALNNISIQYNYCVSKGNLYGYGYKYGYSGLYCSGYSAPADVIRTGDEYVINAQVDWPVYSKAVNATLTVIGTPYYVSASKKDAQLRVSVSPEVFARGQQCKNVSYGYKNKYKYMKCVPIQAKVKVGNAVGSWLKLTRPYGYGYLKKAPVVSATSTLQMATTTQKVIATPKMASSTIKR